MEQKIADGKVSWNNTTKAYKNQRTQFKTKYAQTEAELARALREDDPQLKRYLECHILYEG